MSYSDACEEVSHHLNLFSKGGRLLPAFAQWLEERANAAPFAVRHTIANLDLLLFTPEEGPSGKTFTYADVVGSSARNPGPAIELFNDHFLMWSPHRQTRALVAFLTHAADSSARQRRLPLDRTLVSSQGSLWTEAQCIPTALDTEGAREAVFGTEMLSRMESKGLSQSLPVANLVLALALRNLLSNFLCDWLEAQGSAETNLTALETKLRRWSFESDAGERHRSSTAACDEEGLQNVSDVVATLQKNMSRSCARCGIHNGDALRRCSACRSVYYCGRACQKVHWSEHRQTCASFSKV